jgi:hypothetical protein
MTANRNTDWTWRLPACYTWQNDASSGTWHTEETVFCEAQLFRTAWWNVISSLATAVTSVLIVGHVTSCKIGPHQWLTYYAVVGLAAALLVNAPCSWWYHSQSTRLGRMWDNLSLQMTVWWLACAVLGRKMHKSPPWAGVYAFALIIFVQSWLVGAWYLQHPQRVAWLLVVGVVGSVVYHLAWTWHWCHSIATNRALYSRRWWKMAGWVTSAMVAYWLETTWCSIVTFYCHGVFHVAMSWALFLLVTFILPLPSRHPVHSKLARSPIRTHADDNL